MKTSKSDTAVTIFVISLVSLSVAALIAGFVMLALGNIGVGTILTLSGVIVLAIVLGVTEAV